MVAKEEAKGQAGGEGSVADVEPASLTIAFLLFYIVCASEQFLLVYVAIVWEYGSISPQPSPVVPLAEDVVLGWRMRCGWWAVGGRVVGSWWACCGQLVGVLWTDKGGNKAKPCRT